MPDTGEEKIFAEVIFPDLDKEAATKLVEDYNKVKILYKFRFHFPKNGFLKKVEQGFSSIFWYIS